MMGGYVLINAKIQIVIYKNINLLFQNHDPIPTLIEALSVATLASEVCWWDLELEPCQDYLLFPRNYPPRAVLVKPRKLTRWGIENPPGFLTAKRR